jgi:hypothetical protein
MKVEDRWWNILKMLEMLDFSHFKALGHLYFLPLSSPKSSRYL